MLWGFPFCFCGGTKFPEYPFAPSYNEHSTVEGYGSELVESELVGSAERPIPDEPGLFEKMFHGITGSWWSEGSEDWDRMLHDPEWPSYVDPEYWEEFLSEYPEYYDEVYEYYQNNPTADNNPFYDPEPEDPIEMPLTDDIGAIIGMILMGIAYGILVYRVRRE